MKKKSIVLLITILFISSISILILNNLTSSEKYLIAANKEYSNAQIILLVKNTQKNLLDFFSDKKFYDDYIKLDDADMILPLSLKNIDLSIQVSPYAKDYNINDFFQEDKKKEFILKLENLFSMNRADYYIFSEILNDYYYNYKSNDSNNQFISTSKQLRAIITSFKNKTDFVDISFLYEKIGFLSSEYIEDNIRKQNRYLYCILNLKINKQKYISKFILDINNKGVIDFEFTFK